MKLLGITQAEVAASAPPAVREWVLADDPEAYDDPANWLLETADDIDAAELFPDGWDTYVKFEFAAEIGDGEFINLTIPQQAVYFIARAAAEARPQVFEALRRAPDKK